MDMGGALERVVVGAPIHLVRPGRIRQHGIPQMLPNPHRPVGVARPVVDPQRREIQLPSAVGAIWRANPGVRFRLRAPDVHAAAAQHGAHELEVARPCEVGVVGVDDGVDLVLPLGVGPVRPLGGLQHHGLAHDVALDLDGVEVIRHGESEQAGGFVEHRVVLAPRMRQVVHALLLLRVPRLHVNAFVHDGPVHADGLAHSVLGLAFWARRFRLRLWIRASNILGRGLRRSLRDGAPRPLPHARVLDDPPLVAVPLPERAPEDTEQWLVFGPRLQVDAPVVPGLERAARRPGVRRGRIAILPCLRAAFHIHGQDAL